MREITRGEVQRLAVCLRALAEYHNEVSTHFKGHYPSRPYEKTLQLFEESLAEKTSRIAVIEEDGQIIGYCKIDLHDGTGKLDHLVVLEEHRKKGYGKVLMDWAMQTFDGCDIHHIEVKVIDGNEATHFYERYGFQMNAHILVNDR